MGALCNFFPLFLLSLQFFFIFAHCAAFIHFQCDAHTINGDNDEKKYYADDNDDDGRRHRRKRRRYIT